MFENFSLKAQFKLLVMPVMVLTALLIIFISYSEYKNSIKLETLNRDIQIVEDLRKLLILIAKEREVSLKLITTKSEVMAKRISMDLKKQRSINNTRVKALRNKLDEFSAKEILERVFLKKVSTNIKHFNGNYIEFRKRVDERNISTSELLEYYSSIINGFIDAISTSSLEVIDSSINRNIVIYSIFLKYIDTLSQRDIFLEKIVSDRNISIEPYIELAKIDASIKSINDISAGLVDEELFQHYERLSLTQEVIDVEKINEAILNNDATILQGLKVSKLLSMLRKYQKRLKELDDYISREILTDLSSKIDRHEQRESLLTIGFLTAILIILLSTYAVYNYLRETLFFGTLQIRSKILRVITDMSLSREMGQNENEIRALISLVSTFAKLIKESLSKIRMNFRDIVNLSNHLSESSETIVNHIQKQSRYLEDINLQMAIFLENIRNSEISFENLKDIIEDSSSKINNLNLDVIYISYEVLSLKDLNRKIIENKEKLKELTLSNIQLLQTGENLSSDDIKRATDSFQEMVALIDNQNEILKNKEEKLSNLSKTALSIKKDAEINNANLSDILGVITILGYETKNITSEINRTVEENSNFIDVSKNMVNKSEFVSSDVKMLNKYIVNLDKEFNKFRF